MSGKSRVIMEMSGDEAKLLRSYRNAIKENQRLKDEMRDLARQGRQSSDWTGKFSDDVKKGFNPKNVLAFAGALTGIGAAGASVTGVVSKMVGYLKEANEEVKQYARELSESYNTAKKLWQISEGEGEFSKLSDKQRWGMMTEGLTREQAGEVLFDLRSLGQEQSYNQVIKASRFMDVTTAGNYLTTIASEQNFGAAAGTPDQILSGLAAGAATSAMDADDTAKWVLKAAPTMAAAGSTQEEMLALGSLLAVPAEKKSDTLGTWLQSGTETLLTWKKQAIAAGAEVSEAPTAPTMEAPEMPVYKEPEFRARVGMTGTALINAKLAHDERVEAEKERHAERVAEYDKDQERYKAKQVEYQQKVAEWEAKEERERQIAKAASGAKGTFGLWKTLRESDPEKYAELSTQGVFGRLARELEKAAPKVDDTTANIRKEIESGNLFHKLADETPVELTTEQRRLQVQERHKLATEKKQWERKSLEISIGQLKNFGDVTGQPVVKTKAWEELLETGSIWDTKEANLKATRSLFDQYARHEPELYQKHLDSILDVDFKKTSKGLVPYSVDTSKIETVTPEMTTALFAAEEELMSRRLGLSDPSGGGSAAPVDMTQTNERLETTNDELAGVNGKLDELIDAVKTGQTGMQGELPTSPEPGGHGY